MQSEYNTFIDIAVLDELIRSQSWSEVLAQQDVNTSCDLLMNTLESLKKLATKNVKQTTRYKKIKPWITLELIKGIRKRDKLSKLLKHQPFNGNLRNYYNSFRNQLAKSIKKVKVEYYKKQISQSNGNPKEFWNIIKEFSGVNSKPKNSFPIKNFLCRSDMTDGAVRGVANSFNNYFSQVGHKLASELPPPVGPAVVDDNAHRVEHVMRLEPVTEDQVRRCVQEMRGGSAPGIDNFSTLTLKRNLNFIILPLTHIINLSIKFGVFPLNFKTAKVVPLYKSNDKSSFNSYRPISLLCVLSKVLEKCVKLQLQQFLENNHILAPCQFGFRKGKNSSDALFLLNKFLMESINKNRKSIILFIDLAKAFDSLDKSILFHKLECVGVRNTALKWFKSYLSDRKQIVSICGQTSDTLNVDYGVVQGSTLGPILFLIYINNIDKLNISGRIFLFADDTAVVFEGNTWEEVYRNATHDLQIIKSWFDQNVLTMNVNKTQYLPIALRTVAEPPADLKLVLHTCGNSDSNNCNCHSIERVDQYKYLGVILDSKLRYENHINYLKNKLRKVIFPFILLSQILNEKEIKMVYCAFVQSVIQYGIIAYGGTHRTILEPLSVVQKSIIKAGFQKSKQYPSEMLFRETSIFTVRQLYIKTLLIYTFLNNDLIITPIAHNYPTRNALNIGSQAPRAIKSTNFTNSYFIANILYQNIPQEIRDCEGSKIVFKRLVNSWLLETGSEHAEALITSIYLAT